MFPEHAGPLFAAMRDDEELWRYLPTPMPRSAADMRDWIDDALAGYEQGLRLPFTVFEAQAGCVIGSTSYYNISEPNRNLEIGGTWYRRDFRRTAVNTECKYLLLTHAFETLSCIRVYFKADSRNERSLRAIERLGAVYEGVLRRDRIVKDGYQRSSACYSILDDEWPGVKARLEAMLRR